MAMVLKASATAGPPPPSSSPSSLSSSSPTNFPLPKCIPKPQFNPISIALPTSTTLSLLPLFTAPSEARALSISKEQIVSSLTQVETTIDQVQEVSSNVLDVAERVIQAVIETVKPGIDVALPILQKAGGEAVKVAAPAISEAVKKAQEALQSSGVDTEPVTNVAKTIAGAAQQTARVIEEAKPITSSTVETISSADPISILGAGGVLFLSYLLLPPIFSTISYSFRWYKGDLTPAQTLNLISTRNYIMIDIRPENDKSKAGVPRLPPSARKKMIAIPLEELPNKLRGLVSNVKKVEGEIVALKISYLKAINKGSGIVIMGSYSDSAKIVARALTNLGFKNCWIMADGFSGSRGWLRSQLGTDSYSFSFVEVLSPSRVMPAVGRFGTTNSAKSLP